MMIIFPPLLRYCFRPGLDIARGAEGRRNSGWGVIGVDGQIVLFLIGTAEDGLTLGWDRSLWDFVAGGEVCDSEAALDEGEPGPESGVPGEDGERFVAVGGYG